MLALAAIALLFASAPGRAADSAPGGDGLYALTARSIEGQDVALSKYKGQVLLIVNTASKCGFTPQYKSLQALQDKYAKRGFTVLGFPSNDFFRQEPAANPEIKQFCELRYGVTFPLFEKAPVRGKDKQPVFRYLVNTPVGKKDGEIGWNFVKFLVDRDGRVAARFTTRIDPLAPQVAGQIEKLLDAPSAAN